MSEFSVRVLCYNIRHGQGVGGVFSTRRIARVVNETRCDIAGLAEVWRFPRLLNQPEALAEQTGMPAVFDPLDVTLGREAGNLVLSTLPVSSVRRIPLGGKREARGCLVVEFDEGTPGFAFAFTHLSLDRKTRTRQVETLHRELPRDEPLLFAADLNAPVSEFDGVLGMLTFPTDVPPTYPSAIPFRALDHIGFSRHWELVSLRTARSWASDHLPLVAELRLIASDADVSASTGSP